MSAAAQPMALLYSVESFSSIYPDAKALVERHWAEAATFPDVRRLKINEEKFCRLEAAGGLICIALRYGGRLVGYIAGGLIEPMHTEASVMASMTYYFILREFRGNGGFHDLRGAFEAEAKRRGAVACTARQKLRNGEPTNVPDEFFESCGYEKEEVAWMKRL